MQDFINAWARADPRGTGRIHYKALAKVLRWIGPPLGVGRRAPVDAVDRFLARLPIGVAPDGTVRSKRKRYLVECVLLT